MKTRAEWLFVGALAITAPLAATHCGSSSSKTTGSSGSSGSGGSSGFSSGSGGGTGSSGGFGSGTVSGSSGTTSGAADDGGPPPDGGGSGSTGDGGSSGDGASSGSQACVPMDGGLQCSDPNQVSCGSSICDVTRQYCCVEPADAGSTQSCVAPNGQCTGTKISCNEAADCTGGAVCCGVFPMTGVQSTTSCMTACTGFQTFQICRTDAECGSFGDGGGPRRCVLQTCGMLTLQLCEAPPSPFGPPPGDAGSSGAYPGCMAK